MLFVCENNQYAASTHISLTTSIDDIADRAAAYGMPGVVVDGMDVLAVLEATREAVERARRGAAPLRTRQPRRLPPWRVCTCHLSKEWSRPHGT